MISRLLLLAAAALLLSAVPACSASDLAPVDATPGTHQLNVPTAAPPPADPRPPEAPTPVDSVSASLTLSSDAKPVPVATATHAALEWPPSTDDPEELIAALPWVDGSLSVDEQEALVQLRYIAGEDRTVFWELARKPWIRDGLASSEHQAIVLLASLLSADGVSATQIAGMPFLDSIEPGDLAVLEALLSLDRAGIAWLLARAELGSGDAAVLPATVALLRLGWLRPETAASLTSLPWISDGINPAEVEAVLVLEELALDAPQLFRMLGSNAWLGDGLDRDELSVVSTLRGIAGASMARRDEETVVQLAAMPFLETVDGVVAAAAGSLHQLFWASGEDDYLLQVLAHPDLADGISYDEAFLVAALGIVVEERPDLLELLLDLGADAVERRTVRLPLAGRVTLSVLNLTPGAHGTMDILERALRAQEDFMGAPFPTGYVGLLVADATSAGGGGGPSGLITVDPAYAEDAYIIAHELAHAYWSFWPAWIAEGGAEFMTTISAEKRFSSHDCGLAGTLAELDRIEQELYASGESTSIVRDSGCAYSLGRGLFLELHATLGDAVFRRGFRRLYEAMRDGELDDECAGPELGLFYVKAAFEADARSEVAALSRPVITRWYYGPRN